MLDRMKLGLKLIVAFALLVIVAAGIGGMSIRSMNNMANEENIIYNVNLKSIESIANMMAALRAVGVGERGLLVTKMFSDPEVRKAQFDYVDARMEDLEENWKVFEPIERTAEEEKVWSSFASTFESWKNGHETFMNYMKEKERLIDSGVSEQDARVASIDDKAYEAYMIARGDWLEADNLLMEIEHINDAGALEADEAFKAMAASARTMMLIIIAVGVLLAIALGLYFISNVNGIIRTLMGEAGKLAEAAVNGQLATRGDPEKVNFEFRGIVTGVNDTLDAVIGPLNVAAEYVDRISNGDIPPKITDEYKGDFNEIKNNLNKCIDAVNLLVADASVLSQAAVEGKLATRADASKHQGDFRKIVAGVNDTLDAVIGPLNVAAEYIDRISNGDIPARITDNYNGDFNEIKNNLNKCIDALSGLINDMNHMSKEHDAGDIDVVMDAAKFEGAYKEMASGVNNMVNGHIAVKKKAMACVAEFGKGNFEAPLERFPGKKAFINENIEEVRSRLKALIADANMLSVAAVEGKLATRADASKHQGDFRKIVQGVNDTLDAVIGPLNVAAEYVDRISNGDIPARITDNYNGDFNEIKNNLNKCIDALSGLINDMNHMSKEHDAGDIDVVMDAAKFEGAYKEMASGVNNMVNGHIAVKKKAMACIAEFGKGNFEAPLERFPGKKAFINENIEEVRARLKALIADAVMLAQAAVDGALSTRADVSKHQGDFRKIVQGVNDTLDAVIMPVNEAAEILNYVAQNDLTKLVKGDYKGDHAKIKESLNTAITNLNNVLAQVIDAVTQVGSAAQQISSSAQGVAEGTSEQASSLEEVSSSLEEMSGMTKRNAENAGQAQTLAKSANDSADKGKIDMERMNTAIEDIQKSSDQTAKIVKTIDEIAFQTNLLALNAAVEAARAGEAGKGFAVVAEEVRNLAMRSAEAAKETAVMIEESVKNSNNGVKIAEEVGKSLIEIADGASKVNNLVAEIAAASKEQSQGIDQVNIAMGQMDKVTQANASSAEESASAAEELSSQANQLSEVVSMFKISRNGDGRMMSDMFTGADISLLKQAMSQAKAQQKGNGGSSHDKSESRKLATVGAGKKSGNGNHKKKPEAVIPMDDDFSEF